MLIDFGLSLSYIRGTWLKFSLAAGFFQAHSWASIQDEFHDDQLSKRVVFVAAVIGP